MKQIVSVLQEKAMRLASLGEEWARSKKEVTDSQLHEKAIAAEFRQAEDDFRAAKYEMMSV